MDKSLFRKEALEHQKQRLLGDLVISQPLSRVLLISSLSLLSIVVLAFLSMNTYVRKVQVSGRLVPDKGLIEIHAPQSGQLGQVFVKPGELVQKGQVLFELNLDHTLGSDKAYSEALLQSVSEQERSLLHQLELQDEDVLLLMASKAEELEALSKTRQKLELMLKREKELAAVRYKAFERAQYLFAQHLLAQADMDEHRGRSLEQEQKSEELALQLLQLSAEEDALIREQSSLLIQSFQQSELLTRELASVQQNKLRLSAEQSTLIRAPFTSRISNIHLQGGMMVRAEQQVLALLPSSSQLEAELLLPSEAVGFIAAKQEVKIRFDAFPYQKFGVHKGQITQVTESTEEHRINEMLPTPVYRARAVLDKQSITAFGTEHALRPGMLFSADVMLDERSLLEWLLEPLFSITGGV